MKINKTKSIGRVIFVVEGSRSEFSLLKRIFCNILGYEFLEKRRNATDFIKSGDNAISRVAVINSSESNISSISNENEYLDRLFELLIEQNFPVDNAAIYYLFDRDPLSNTDDALITKLLLDLKNPYENDNGLRGGLLLLSYPSIESYIVSNFVDETHRECLALGLEAKAFVAARNTEIQLNKISESTIELAAIELFKYLAAEEFQFNIDSFAEVNNLIFSKQEKHYKQNSTYKMLSLLSIAFIQLGIIDLD